jgi:hypothetical protein
MNIITSLFCPSEGDRTKIRSVKYAVQDKYYLTAFLSALVEQSHYAGKEVRDVSGPSAGVSMRCKQRSILVDWMEVGSGV